MATKPVGGAPTPLVESMSKIYILYINYIINPKLILFYNLFNYVIIINTI